MHVLGAVGREHGAERVVLAVAAHTVVPGRKEDGDAARAELRVGFA